jgi:signal transduction histidine kinase
MVKYAVVRFFIDIYNWVDFIILILAVMIFLPIRNYYYKIANKYFFTSLYDSRKVIGKLSDKLRSTLELKMIYGHISDVLLDAFHVKAMGILIRDKKEAAMNPAKSGGEDQYTVQYNKGFNIGARAKFPGNKKLCNLFLRHNKSIVVEEIRSASYKEFKGTIDLLTKFGAEVVTPLNIKGKVIGLIILGRKESGDMYNDQDLRVLEIVGAQAAIAIENAVLYEVAKNFNIKLKKEVKEATAELRAANEELKRLDVAKSEFISIASHQLRTPLTIIKGYISMLIEGSFGRLTDKETGALKKVFESNERLIQLVEDLLDISRVESGRLQFNFKEIRLEQIVDSVVNELAPIAQKRGLELKYKIANKLLPKIKIDEEKIRQVIMNLIDNSIKYTEKGSIVIDLSRAGGNIHFCVTDTGRGIRKNEFPSLFKKFSRGKGTFLIDTGGNGLGLYVGKMMIEAHHGKIWAESEGKDKGAKFCFTLPAER